MEAAAVRPVIPVATSPRFHPPACGSAAERRPRLALRPRLLAPSRRIQVTLAVVALLLSSLGACAPALRLG